MAITKRTINIPADALTAQDGTVLDDVDVTFLLVNTSNQPTDAWDVVTGERIAPIKKTVKTSAGGSVSLWPNDRGSSDNPTYYRCTVKSPDVRQFLAALPSGDLSPLSWIEFSGNTAPISSETYPILQSLTGVLKVVAGIVAGNATAADVGAVANTGSESIAGAKTFTDPTVFQATAENESPVLGDEFLTGGAWTSDGWTGDNVAGWSWVGGSPQGPLSYNIPAVIDTLYKIEFSITSPVGYVELTFGGSASGLLYDHTANVITLTATAIDGLIITAGTSFTGTITVSIKALLAPSPAMITYSDASGVSIMEIRNSPNALLNTFIGKNAGGYNLTGAGNAIGPGVDSFSHNTTGSANSIGAGNKVLHDNTSGTYNSVGAGMTVLIKNTTGSFNSVGAGALTLARNTTGSFNSVGAGCQVLFNNVDGSYNSVGAGYYAIYRNTSGCHNSVGAGYYVLHANTTGSYNAVGAGCYALQSNTTGSYNTALGSHAGIYLTTGSNNTFIGSHSGNHASQLRTAENSMALGNGTYTTADNQIMIGNTDITETILRGRVALPAVVSNARTVTDSNATMLINDYTIRMSTGATARTVDLSAAVVGQIVKIKKIDSGAGAVTFVSGTSCTIDGSTSRSLASQYALITLQCVAAGAVCVFDII